MNKYVRVLIALALVLGIAFLARNKVAWANPAPQVDASAPLQDDASTLADKTDPGTVKPPLPEIKFCEDGVYSAGGISTIKARNLAPGYCLEAFLHNKNYALGRIPDGAGKILANVTFLRVFYQGKFVYEVPSEDGDVEICYALPPGTQAQIYFYNHYGPRFGKGKGQPSWEPLQTTVVDGMACASAQTSGAYALIGQ